MLDDAVLGAFMALVIASLTTPVGVSGAVFLVPVQVSVLGVASPAVTPTNLLYNLIAIPGALWRFHREGRLRSPLLSMLAIGSLLGVIAGAVIHVELLSSAASFFMVIAAVLTPLGAWLALGKAPTPRPAITAPGHSARIVALSLAVGVVGGIYGIGGGAILAPILVGMGYALAAVAPATLAATFLTSLAGVAAYAVLSIDAEGSIAPEWTIVDRPRAGRPGRKRRRSEPAVAAARDAAPPVPRGPGGRPGPALLGARHLLSLRLMVRAAQYKTVGRSTASKKPRAPAPALALGGPLRAGR